MDLVSGRRHTEAGAVLVAVMLLLALVLALGTALSLGATAETLVARNHLALAEAQAAAEAALAHAAEITLSRLRDWQADGHATPMAAVTALLVGPDGQTGSAAADVDNGSLEAWGIPRPPATLPLAGRTDVRYTARLLDDDDPQRSRPLGAPDIGRIGENGLAFADGNGRFVIRASGFAAWNASVHLEAIVRPRALPAVVSGGRLVISGRAALTGAHGGAHANGDLILSESAAAARDVTASGTVTVAASAQVGGRARGSMPPWQIGRVDPADYRPLADFVLTSTGMLTTAGGEVLCDGSAGRCQAAGHGWTFQDGSGWALTGDGLPPGTYYVQGAVLLASSPGSPAAPARATIVAEGSLEITGNPVLGAAAANLLFVAGGDLRIQGDSGRASTFTGRILVREQAHIGGKVWLSGQLTVANASDESALVAATALTDDVTIASDGSDAAIEFVVAGRWW